MRTALFLALVLASAARAEDTTPPVIHHTPVTSTERGAKFVIVFATITDESKFYPQVFYRYGPGEYQKPIDMKKVQGKKNEFGANIPVEGDLVEYYIEAYDDFGNGPARSGDPDHPHRVDTTGQGGAVAQQSMQPKKETPKPPEPVVEKPAPRPRPVASTATAAPAQRMWTWIVGGAGVGLLAGGTLAGMAFKSADDAYQQRLKDPLNSPGSLQAQYDANKSLGTKATIMMISGGVLLAGSVALWFIEGPKSSSSKDEGGLVGAVAPADGGATVALAGRF